MSILLDVKGKSQYDKDITDLLRPSACGPVTAHVIMKHLSPTDFSFTVNELYTLLGGTKVGLTKKRFIHNLRKILGQDWIVATCTIDEVKRHLEEGRPVAAKFDKWFNFKWRGGFEFDYHWVPVIGYEIVANDIVLMIHDNGSKNQPSRIRRISYNHNRPVLSFVKIEQVKG